MTDKVDLRNALAYIQRPDVARWLSQQIVDALDEIEGYSAVPHEVQKRIAEICAGFYGVGYVRGRGKRS